MSVDFDPTRVRSRRRRVEPVFFAVAAVLVALGAAVIKPWDVGGGTTPSPSLVAAATEPARRPARAELPTWGEFTAIAHAFDGWGVHTIARRHTPPWSSDVPSYVEAWVPTTPGSPDGLEATIKPGDGPVVLLGLTVASDVRPDAVRIWRVHLDDQLERIDAYQIDPVGPVGSLLFIRPGTDGAAYDPWPAGHYRFDLLDALGIVPVTVGVADRAGNVPPMDAWARSGQQGSARSHLTSVGGATP